MVNQLVNFDTIQHNRLYIPEDKSLLTFEVFSPAMVTPGAKISVRFAPTDLDPTLPNVAPIEVELKPGFFEKNQYYVEIPEAAHSVSVYGAERVNELLAEHFARV